MQTGALVPFKTQAKPKLSEYTFEDFLRGKVMKQRSGRSDDSEEKGKKVSVLFIVAFLAPFLTIIGFLIQFNRDMAQNQKEVLGEFRKVDARIGAVDTRVGSIDQQIKDFEEKVDIKISGLSTIITLMGAPGNDVDHLFNQKTNKLTLRGEQILTPEIRRLFDDKKVIYRNSDDLALSVINVLGKIKMKQIIADHNISRPENLFSLFVCYADSIL